MAKIQYKFARPATPFTDKVLDEITAKTNLLLRKFRDFDNPERQESDKHEIMGRFHEEVMKAYGKFKDNDKCSYESYASIFLNTAVKHYIRDRVRLLKIEKATVSGDTPIDSSDEESPTRLSTYADPTERILDELLDFDYREIVALMRDKYPICARILELRRDGYQLNEMDTILGIPQKRLYNVLWPKAKQLFIYVLNFSKNS